MSSTASEWAFWVIPCLKDHVEKLVLLRLADRADPAGTCWPGHNRTAADLGLSLRSVQRSIKRLRDLGFIKVESRPGTDLDAAANVIEQITFAVAQRDPEQLPREAAEEPLARLLAEEGLDAGTVGAGAPPAAADCGGSAAVDEFLSRPSVMSAPAASKVVVAPKPEKPPQPRKLWPAFVECFEQFERAHAYTVPSVSITTARTGASSRANELGMRAMQERAYAKRGEQYLLIKSPPASGKSRALMFIALDKLHNQGLKQAIVVVPERSIGGSFADEALTRFGFFWDWQVAPQWNLCNAPGGDEPRAAKSKVDAVRLFLACSDKVLVCTHATFRFAVEAMGIEAFDDRLIAIDEFHHVSSNPDNVLGGQLGALIARDKVHLVAMTGSYFRGDSEAVLGPADESRFETITYTYYEQLNGYPSEAQQ